MIVLDAILILLIAPVIALVLVALAIAGRLSRLTWSKVRRKPVILFYLHVKASYLEKIGKTHLLLDAPYNGLFGKCLTVSFPHDVDHQTYFPESNHTFCEFARVFPFLKSIGLNYSFYLLNFFIYLAKVFDLILKNHVDVIKTDELLIDGFAGMILSRIFGVPLVGYEGTGFDFKGRDLAGTFRLGDVPFKIVQWVGASCDVILTPQAKQVEYFKSIGIDPSRVAVVRHPLVIDLTKDFNRELSDRLSREYAGLKLVLYYGRLEPQKYVDVIIKAFCVCAQNHPELRLAILGTGSDEGRLRELVAAQDAGPGGRDIPASGSSVACQIFMVPEQKFRDAAAYISNCSVSIQPTGGKTLFETGYFGKPVIIFDENCWDYELIKDGETGLIARFNDVVDMSAKLECLLSDDALSARLGRNLQALVARENSREAVIASLRAIYVRVLSARANHLILDQSA